MSFSSIIKDELCRVEPPNDCCARAELAAAYLINAAGGAPQGCVITENAAFARRAYGLIKDITKAQPEITIKKNRRLKNLPRYIVRAHLATKLAIELFGVPTGNLGNANKSNNSNKSIKSNNFEDADLTGFTYGAGRFRRIVKKKCCKRAALRGAFLAGGSVTNPEKLYHLEIYCKKPELAHLFSGFMSDFRLNPKITERMEYSVAYIKDSEKIADFLNITGAHRALMSLENTKILKDMRNSVNRTVNCETANLEKTVNASLRQIANIIYIKNSVGYDALPKGLRDIAMAREANREISLKELGQLLTPPLGKSGVNHRLRRIEAIADEIRQKHSPRQIT